MASVEAEIKRRVYKHKEDVYFEIKVSYDGNNAVPWKIKWRACSEEKDFSGNKTGRIWELERDLWLQGIANATDIEQCENKSMTR